MKYTYLNIVVLLVFISSLLACGEDDSTAKGAGSDGIGSAVDVPVSISGGDTTSTEDAGEQVVGPGPDTQTSNPPTNRGGDPKIGVDPENYSFSYVSPLDHTMVKQVNFFNGGYAPLVITGIEFLSGASQDFMIVGIPVLPMTLAPGKQGFVNVGFQEKEGGEGTLRISSSDPNNPSIDVVFSSILKATLRNPPEACAGLTPSSLNFGTVVRGNSKTLSAELTNCSTEVSLTLTKISRSSFFFIELTEEFQLTPMPGTPKTLAPGESMEIFVEYSPKLAGLDSGHFSFYTDDPAQPELHLDLMAVGQAPPVEDLGLSIKLSWDADLTDVDSHFISPNGTLFDCDEDCHYGNPSPDWGVAGDWLDDPFLDVDDVDGYGPEHINISEPIPGTYTFIVHYYQDSFEFSQGTPTTASVEVSSKGQLLASFGPKPLDATNRTWDVFTVEWPSMAITELGNTYMLPASSVQACLPFSFP